MTLEELQTEVWEAYKDAYGVRPRHLTDAQWNDSEFLVSLLEICVSVIDYTK